MKRLNTMIRMVLGDCPGAIKLFCEDNSHHAVWQSQTRDPDQAIGIGFESSIEPIGTADDKHDITTILLPVAEVLGQRNASPVLPRSSKAMTRAFLGITASILARSNAMTVSAVLLPERSMGFISLR